MGTNTRTTSVGAKLAAAIVGGLIGFCIGPFLGTMAGGLLGSALGSEGPEPSEVGNVLGMGIGLIGGACLGVFLVGLPRAGVILLVIGLAIAALGTLQFFAVLALSGDPTINPVINGVLMWLSWGLGGLLIVVGAAMTLIARMSDRPAGGAA